MRYYLISVRGKPVAVVETVGRVGPRVALEIFWSELSDERREALRQLGPEFVAEEREFDEMGVMLIWS